MNAAPPELSVIVPVHSRTPALAELFEKLFLSGLRAALGRRAELVIIDDASPLAAATAAAAEAARGWADVVFERNGANLGYLRSANRGLALARGRRLLLCNSDTRPAPNAVERLLAALETAPELGLAGPVSNGAFNAKLQQQPGAPARLRSLEPEELARFDAYGAALPPAPPVPAGWLMGFCLLLRREVYETVGPFDEAFGFGYLEELDYAIRARRAGWKLAVAPGAFVFHGGPDRGWQPAGTGAGSQTARTMPLRTALRIGRGVYTMVRKYGWDGLGLPQDEAGTAARGF